MNNCSYEQSFICSPAIYGSIMHKKYILNLCNITNTKTLHRCRSYPSYHPDPIPYNALQSHNLIQHITLSHIIHYAIIYYTPYNYISIMYISCCYHLSITYYIFNHIIVSHTMQSNILLLCVVLLYLISTRI